MNQENPEPWESPGPLFHEVTWCDACGEPVAPGERVTWDALPCDVAAANAGESATTCPRCAADIRRMIGGRAHG